LSRAGDSDDLRPDGRYLIYVILARVFAVALRCWRRLTAQSAVLRPSLTRHRHTTSCERGVQPRAKE